MLALYDPAPWFHARSTVNPRYSFDTVGGRYVVLTFFGSAADPAANRVLADVRRQQARFDGTNAVFFGVSTDPDDERLGRVRQEFPGAMYFWDFDRAVNRLYGVAGPDAGPGQRVSFVLDPALRVLAVVPFGPDPAAHVRQLLAVLDAHPPARSVVGVAPVLQVPGVFDPAFCRTLIDLYEAQGGKESGFMREVDGQTVALVDHTHKRRADHDITDQDAIRTAHLALRRRLLPAIKMAFQFDVTRIERNIVACYDGETGGFFNRHRDNTTKGTAHRRFACTLNLNTGEYDGGELWFPEFGTRAYKAPAGGAVVFSCSLLHEATPVTRGKRYAYLPFLYDEAAARVRQENQKFLAATAADR